MTATTATPPVVLRRSAWGRVRDNLFGNTRSAVITILLVPILVYLAYRVFLFLFINGQWEAVRRNLTLFMQGTFPRSEQWRLVTQLILFGLAAGVAAGTASAASRDGAAALGRRYVGQKPLAVMGRYWSVIAFALVLLLFASTATPWLVAAATVAAFLIGTTSRLIPGPRRSLGWLLAALVLVAIFQVVAGTVGRAWLATAVIAVLMVWELVPFERLPPGLATLGARIVSAVVVTVVVYLIYATVVVLPGLPWDVWSGLHLTLWASAIAIVLSFPLGLLLALARRSTFPALRLLATGYIELIRGVPLITLLFMGQYILGFMLPLQTDLSSLSRAIAAMTLFTAAYVAEIVRGGLQSVPRGQTEASQALGMAPMKTTRLIVLPQALRAVIPAMVGQFISIFKDSSLLYIIAITEFLSVRSLVHAQADFRSVSHAEVLLFVTAGYWAFSYAMSKGSQRLERRLGVGYR